MKRVIYIGKDETYINYGHTGWINENKAFLPDGSKDSYMIPVNCLNFFFPNE